MIDTMDICNTVTQHFQDELHRPAYPYKIKNKISGCACDCVAAIARADVSVIGTWKGDIQINQAEVKKYADGGMDIQADVIDWCPTECMSFDGSSITIDNAQCNRCMHCITRMTKALKPGKERGASILVGSKAPIVVGSLLSWVVVPFMKMESPFEEYIELLENMIEWWDDNAKPRERIGELIEVKGMRPFLEAIGVDPQPQQVYEPRKDPFFFWAESDFK
jgi:sulfite reductase alpha subunit